MGSMEIGKTNNFQINYLNNKEKPQTKKQDLGFSRNGDYLSSKASLSFKAMVILNDKFRLPKIYKPKQIPEIIQGIDDIQSGKNSINQLSLEEKKDFIRDLAYLDSTTSNEQGNENSPLLHLTMSEKYPILKDLVESLSIGTTPLDNEGIKHLNDNLFKLPDILKNIDFGKYKAGDGNKLLTLEFPTKDFMNEAQKITSDLSDEEQRKVYGYFGFEINDVQNKFGQFIRTVMGYIGNSDKDYKSSGIEDKKTIKALEKLRPLVIKYNENNKILSDNQELADVMNGIIKEIPELRTTIAKDQHGTHDFTVDTHSLRVLKAIVEDPKFDTLNDSDKKIMILAGLMHDITKTEGVVDKSHPNESGFDSFYISQRFGLTEDEHEKLYNIINEHAWSERANVGRSQSEKQKQIVKEIAYSLRKGNTFSLSKMFAKADLTGVTESGSFIRAYGSDVDAIGDMIEAEIKEINAQD